MTPDQLREWGRFTRSMWRALGAPWSDVCRLVAHDERVPSFRLARRGCSSSYGWCHLENHGNCAGIYLEPAEFVVGEDGQLDRRGLAIDVAVRLEADRPEHHVAAPLVALVNEIDPGLGVECATYPNRARDDHPADRVVVCVPTGDDATRRHGERDQRGVWIGVRHELSGVHDHKDARAHRVARKLGEQLGRLHQTVRLALAYLAEKPPEVVSFKDLFSWCGEYVVAHELAGWGDLRWHGAYSPCDFVAKSGDVRAIEVKASRSWRSRPVFSLEEVRCAVEHGDGYRVARVDVDTRVVLRLQHALRAREPGRPGPQSPLWSRTLPQIASHVVSPDEELEALLRELVSRARVEWYANPFTGMVGEHLAAILFGSAAALADGTVEVFLRDAQKTVRPWSA